MSIAIIQDRLRRYGCITPIDEENALKEITQEIVLLALSRREFFKIAAFHGGTCLRIVHGLQRFSEDLDFELTEYNKDFQLHHYLVNIEDELAAYGYNIEVQDRRDSDKTVRKAFLKDDSLGKVLLLKYPQPGRAIKKIRIKLEVDTSPPMGANYQTQHLDFPMSFAIRSHDLASLFAGKMAAILTRKYLKGRDWYDFLWYISKKTDLNFNYLSQALKQAKILPEALNKIDAKGLTDALRNKIVSTPWKEAANDVQRFLKPHELPSLELWSQDFFLAKLERLLSQLVMGSSLDY